LVVWDVAADRTSFTALQRRIVAGRGLYALIAAWPAHMVCFDLLQDRGAVLLDDPLDQRRGQLESLLTHAPAAIQLCPQTADLDQARRWTDELPATGIEGVL
jgi:ATP-dependent DNA ligase